MFSIVFSSFWFPGINPFCSGDFPQEEYRCNECPGPRHLKTSCTKTFPSSTVWWFSKTLVVFPYSRYLNRRGDQIWCQTDRIDILSEADQRCPWHLQTTSTGAVCFCSASEHPGQNFQRSKEKSAKLVFGGWLETCHEISFTLRIPKDPQRPGVILRTKTPLLLYTGSNSPFHWEGPWDP